MNLIHELEQEQIAKLSTGKEIPDFGPGDTVLVNVKVVEGERTRIQAYEGVCIGRAFGALDRPFKRNALCAGSVCRAANSAEIYSAAFPATSTLSSAGRWSCFSEMRAALPRRPRR